MLSVQQRWHIQKQAVKLFNRYIASICAVLKCIILTKSVSDTIMEITKVGQEVVERHKTKHCHKFSERLHVDP